jgi:type II secretory pathway component PulF
MLDQWIDFHLGEPRANSRTGLVVPGGPVDGFTLPSPEITQKTPVLRFRHPAPRSHTANQLKKSAVSRFAISMSTLLKSGVPVLESLRIVKDIVGNQVLARVLDTVHKRIIEGTDIATPIKRSGVFPPVVGYMIAVGEQSGQLEEMLDRVAEAYDEEVSVQTQKVTSLLEPLLIVGMAFVVGFIVISVMLPILKISDIRSIRR